jgi:hypothetical protein
MRNLRFLFLSAMIGFFTPACSPKSGCPANESLKVQTSKKGGFKKGKTQSGLFPKKMSKKMR